MSPTDTPAAPVPSQLDALYADAYRELRRLANAGKTTLARTLLGQSVGEVRDAAHVTLTTHLGEHLAGDAGETEILRVHEALDELAKLDARMAQVVELRYFAGMTEGEIGQALGVTERTVRRDWQQARLFLAEALR